VNTEETAKNLNQLVAECYALMAQLHLAHWNVEGSDFVPLHELFQAQYEDLFAAIDEIAERVRALNEYAEGGIKRLAEMSSISEGPSKSSASSQDWVNSVLKGHETIVKLATLARKQASETGDAETEDLLIGRIQVHQKAIWFLKSYLA